VQVDDRNEEVDERNTESLSEEKVTQVTDNDLAEMEDERLLDEGVFID
jgi:hypothetical protein